MSKTKRRGPKPIKSRRIMTRAELEAEWARIKNEAVKDALLVFLELMIAMPMKVMHDHYGWGAKKRLPELADLLAEEFDVLSREGMDPDEYVRMVAETCGINVEAKPGEE